MAIRNLVIIILTASGIVQVVFKVWWRLWYSTPFPRAGVIWVEMFGLPGYRELVKDAQVDSNDSNGKYLLSDYSVLIVLYDILDVNPKPETQR